MYIISAYYPSGNNNTNLKSEINKLVESMDLENGNNYYISAGDLNCKHTEWGNPVNNQNGSLLKESLTDNEIRYRCKLYASSASSYPRTGSFLDVCIADCRLHIVTENDSLNCLKTLDYDSNHNAVQINATVNNEQQNFTFLKDYSESKYNYKD